MTIFILILTNDVRSREEGRNKVKITKTVTQGGQVANTHYINGFQYTKGALDFFPHAACLRRGRNDREEDTVEVTHNTGLGGVTSYNYIFHYVDHLGNIRLRYGQDPDDEQVKILEEKHYYPFGLQHKGYNTTRKGFSSKPGNNSIELTPVDPFIGTTFNYGFGGKEYDDSMSLNTYDFGARNYDPALSRWMNMDALSEQYYPISPYTYAANNPIYFTDPDGNRIIIYSGSGSRKYTDTYTYKENRDYSKYRGFLKDTYMALDALYEASNIEVDGQTVNLLDNLINDPKELSIVQTSKNTNFALARKYNKDGTTKERQFSTNIGTLYFNNKNGVLFDDTNDTDNTELENMLESNTLPNTALVNSPTSLLGHDIAHAYNWNNRISNDGPWGNDYGDRKKSGEVYRDGIRFKNEEEARATSMSTQINIQLKENPRKNHKGFGVPTQGVKSNKIKNK